MNELNFILIGIIIGFSSIFFITFYFRKSDPKRITTSFGVAIITLPLIVFIVVPSIGIYFSHMHTIDWNNKVDSIKDVISQREESPSSLTGKCIVWDLSLNQEYSIDYPPGVRASPDDKEVIFFLITERNWFFVGKYRPSGLEGYHTVDVYGEKLSIAIVRWPNKEYLGTLHFTSHPPSEFVVPGGKSFIYHYSAEGEVEEWLKRNME